MPPPPMRVLITMTGSWGTGSGTVVEATVAELARLGHTVCVLHPETEGAPRLDREPAPEARHEIWRFPLADGDVRLDTFPLMIPDPNPTSPADAPTFRDLTDAQRALYIRAFRDRFAEVVADFRPDIVECHHIWLMPFAVAELGVPFVVSAHHSDQMGYRYDETARPFADRAARAASAVLTLTESNRAEVLDLYGIPEDRVAVLGNGYDRETFFPTAPDRSAALDRLGMRVPEGEPIVTFAGKLSHTKGVDILLDAHARLNTRRLETGRPPIHIALFGTGDFEAVRGEETPDLARIHRLGHRPYADLRDAHALARCSVMPSRTEGFGLAALEAMGCGLPVIVTEVGAAESFAVGAAIPPAEVEPLAEAIDRLVELPESEWRALSAEALTKARTFSWAAITAERVRHYAAARAQSGTDSVDIR